MLVIGHGEERVSPREQGEKKIAWLRVEREEHGGEKRERDLVRESGNGSIINERGVSAVV